MTKPILVVQATTHLSREQQSELLRIIRPVAEAIGAEPLVSDASSHVALHQDLTPILEEMKKQTALLQELVSYPRKAEQQAQLLRDVQSRTMKDLMAGGGHIGEALRKRREG